MLLLVEYWIHQVLTWGAIGLSLWGAIDAVTRPMAAYVAAEKLTKPAWIAICAVAGLVIYLFGFLSFLGLPAMVAVGVYLADVRPALREIQQGGGSRW